MVNSENFTTDAEYQELCAEILEWPEKYPSLKVQDQRIFIRLEPRVNQSQADSSIWKLWVTKKMILKLLSQEHDSPLDAHGGICKTLERLRRMYYWPRMPKQVREYISKCDICKTTKAPNNQPEEQLPIHRPKTRPQRN